MKKCTACETEKSLNEFPNRALSPDGKAYRCRLCVKKFNLEFRRSVTGLVRSIYLHQKENSVKRGHPIPEYSYDELYTWILVQENFTTLYAEWKDAGYNTKLVPSVDRLDDYEGYNLTNIRVVTWDENRSKLHVDVRAGRNTKATRQVTQHQKDGTLVAGYHSMSEAARAVNGSAGAVQHCCEGRRKTHKLFVWKYKLI